MELTWAGELHQSGIELGRREGIAEGRLDAGRRLLGLILSQRFGELPPALVDRLESLEDPARVEELSREALVASTLEEVEALFVSG